MKKLLLLISFGLVACGSTTSTRIPVASSGQTTAFQNPEPQSASHTTLATKVWRGAGREVTWKLEMKPPGRSLRSSYCYHISPLSSAAGQTPASKVSTQGLFVPSIIHGNDPLVSTQQVLFSPTGKSILIVEEIGDASNLQNCKLIRFEGKTKSDHSQSITLPESPGPLVRIPGKVLSISDSTIYYWFDHDTTIRELLISDN